MPVNPAPVPLSVAAASNSSPLRVRAWLDHLRVMSELPYPSLALMPSIVALLRERLDAVFASYGWVHGEQLEPEAFWVERIHESAMRWFQEHFREVHDDVPLRAMVQSDGDIIRQVTSRPEYVHNPLHTGVLITYGVRWVCCLPFFGAQGNVHGFLHLYRAEHQPLFSDDDQALLRRARTAVGPIDRGHGPYRQLPPAHRQRVASARLVFDRHGRMRSRTENALPMLFLANVPRMGVLDWACFDTQVLPETVRAPMQAWMKECAARGSRTWTVEVTWGTFEFIADRMVPVAGAPDELQWLVTLNYLEPQDLTLARRLVNWPLSPQEKRILIASTRDATLADVASALDITLGSLKNYVNGLLQRHGVHTRSELVEQVLRTRAPGDPLIV